MDNTDEIRARCVRDEMHCEYSRGVIAARDLEWHCYLLGRFDLIWHRVICRQTPSGIQVPLEPATSSSSTTVRGQSLTAHAVI